MEKSHVGMGHEVCPVCGTNHNEVVLLDRRLRKTLTSDITTGMSLCPECKSKSAEYLALVGVSNTGVSSKLNPQDAIRTGELVHIRRTVAKRIFNIPLDDKLPMAFVDSEVINHLKKLQAGS
jgi:uncharacterized protein (UPF0212 family)